MDGADFRPRRSYERGADPSLLPSAEDRKKLCRISDELNTFLFLPSGADGDPVHDVWRCIYGEATIHQGRRIEPVVPTDQWKVLRRRTQRSTAHLRRDLVALLPPEQLADLRADQLAELGPGGRLLATMDRPQRDEMLRVGRLWDRDPVVDLELAADLKRQEVMYVCQSFFRPGRIRQDDAQAAVRDLLEVQREVRADPRYAEVPRGRKGWERAHLSRIEDIHRRCQRASCADAALNDDGISSLGIIRIKLLRVTAQRLAQRWAEFRTELGEVTQDIVYAPAPPLEPENLGQRSHAASDGWMELLDWAEAEWGYQVRHEARTDGSVGSDIAAAAWLLPQVMRLGHHEQACAISVREDGTLEGRRQYGDLNPAVLSDLVDLIGHVSPRAAVNLLQAARCVPLWDWLTMQRLQPDQLVWQDLARWAQAAWIRGYIEAAPRESSALANAIEDAQREHERYMASTAIELLRPRMIRWDAYRLNEVVGALRKGLNPRPERPRHDSVLAPARRAVPIRSPAKGPHRAQSATDQRLADALAEYWFTATPPGVEACLEAAQRNAGTTRKTLRNRIRGFRRDYGTCAECAQLWFIKDLVQRMAPQQRLRAGWSLLGFAKALRCHRCQGCDKDEVLRLLGTDGFLPPLDSILGLGAEDLEQYSLLMSAQLKDRHDPRWTHELMWAAKYAAGHGAVERALQHWQASFAGGVGRQLTEDDLAVLATVGLADLVRTQLAKMDHGTAFERAVSAALRASHDAGQGVVARGIEANLFERLTVLEADSAPTKQDAHVFLLHQLAERAALCGDRSSVLAMAAKAEQTVEPSHYPYLTYRELLRARAAEAQHRADLELAALRAAYRSCQPESTWAWTAVMPADRFKRLVDLESEIGDALAGELLVRRVATSSVRKWLVDHMPAEQQRWLELAQRGEASMASDALSLDPHDWLLEQHLLPSRLVSRLCVAVARVSLHVVAELDGVRVVDAAEVADQFSDICRQHDRIPVSLLTGAACTEGCLPRAVGGVGQ